MLHVRLACVALAFLSLGCAHRGASPERPPLGDPAGEALASATDVVVVGFRDSSVPPPGHRSHTITITRTEIRRVVHGYDDVYEDRRAPLRAGTFDRVLGALGAYGVLAAEHPSEDGCAGGTRHFVKVERDDAIVLDGSISHCGGIDSGTLEGATAAFVADVERITDAHLGAYREPRAGRRRR